MAARTNVNNHRHAERMLKELGIKHRYTRPYRPQTNWQGGAVLAYPE